MASVTLGAVTIAALDLILLIGASGEPPPWFGVLVLVMDAALLASSVTFGVLFFRRRIRLLGALFLANLLLLLGAFLLRIAGVQFPRFVLFGADLYWLNLYIVGLVSILHERLPAPNQALQM